MKSIKQVMALVLSIFAIGLTQMAVGATWSEIRTSGQGTRGWQPIACENGSGWRSCEMGYNIVLTATIPQIAAVGETTWIIATVTDYYGAKVVGATVTWATTDGSLSGVQSVTDVNGQTAAGLTSSSTIGGANVTASTVKEGGSGVIWVPFTDKFGPYPSAYTGWANYGAPYSCGGWSPDPATVAVGTWFTQYQSCTQTQYRYRQDRQISLVTGSVTNVGAQVAEFQAIYVSQSQGAQGTKAPPAPVCSYIGPGTGYAQYSWMAEITTVRDSSFKYNFTIYLGIQNTGTGLSSIGLINAPDFNYIDKDLGTSAYTIPTGFVDFGGYRYTVGPYVTKSSFSRGEHWRYLHQVCRVPL